VHYTKNIGVTQFSDTSNHVRNEEAGGSNPLTPTIYKYY